MCEYWLCDEWLDTVAAPVTKRALMMKTGSILTKPAGAVCESIWQCALRNRSRDETINNRRIEASAILFPGSLHKTIESRITLWLSREGVGRFHDLENFKHDGAEICRRRSALESALSLSNNGIVVCGRVDVRKRNGLLSDSWWVQSARISCLELEGRGQPR